MATAGPFAGRLAEVAIGNAAVANPETGNVETQTYVEIERVLNPRISGTNDTAETTSNDSGGSKQRLYTLDDATLSFEFVADDNATVQNTHVWQAWAGKEVRGFRLRARGNSATDYEIFMWGLITSIEQTSPLTDASRYTVTVQKTGPLVRNTQ